jgi:hypothetical protein
MFLREGLLKRRYGRGLVVKCVKEIEKADHFQSLHCEFGRFQKADCPATLFAGGQSNLKFSVVEGKEETFVCTGLACFQENWALCGASERDEDNIIANFAHLSEYFETIRGTYSDAIQVEADGVELGALHGVLDFFLRGGKRDAKLDAEMLPELWKKVLIVGNQRD